MIKLNCSLDIGDLKNEPIINIDNLMDVSEFACFVSKDEIVFLGNLSKDNDEHSHRGIYLYNLVSQELKLLFEKDDEYINNFVLMSN